MKEKNQWPCFFSHSDTSGEKEYEEFFVEDEDVDLSRFESLGVVKNSATASEDKLDLFLTSIAKAKESGKWSREDLLQLFRELLPSFIHSERGKSLDEKM